MTKFSIRLSGCLLVLLIAAGCSMPQRESIQKQTFLLTVEHPKETGVEPVEACFSIRMPRVAPAFSGSQLVYRTGPVTFEQDYYNTYLSTPEEQLDEIIKRWFRDSRQFACHPSGGAANEILTLEPHLDELYIDFEDSNPEAVVQMHFYLSRYDTECSCPVEILKKSYVARTPIPSPKPSPDMLVTALSQSLAQVLLELEQDTVNQLKAGR